MNIARDQGIALDTSATFADEVEHGLTQKPKSLPCKWFYDDAGSRLFEKITKTAEYYPTRVETRLLLDLVDELANFIPHLDVVVEPGSGSSIKTRILLESQPKLKQYIPIDISEEFLLETAQQLKYDFPELEIAPIVADFTTALTPLALDQNLERMVFFPGSTIGNFSPDEASQLLNSLHTLVGSNSWLLIGVDMTQDEEKLLAAYNDVGGITAKFNRNILVRANKELGTDFNIRHFTHQAIFNQNERRVEMHLVSTRAQTVHLEGKAFEFEAYETIHTENCYKYSLQDFTDFANECGWQLEHVWTDQQESNFGVFLLKARS
ncbi:MAG TPA: L-histidine N(alpha)-methyltransferase [Methylophilaceae bacterium]|jgi:dimethylhistidine N-methyltransferase